MESSGPSQSSAKDGSESLASERPSSLSLLAGARFLRVLAPTFFANALLEPGQHSLQYRHRLVKLFFYDRKGRAEAERVGAHVVGDEPLGQAGQVHLLADLPV